jgi:YidC/Oxa1 family membrane protein insertase
MAVFLGLVTAWQAAVIQIYFLCSGILGAGTGWLLRQNTFRSLIRIRPLPSPASNALYTKVVKGDLRLADIKGKDGKVRYQAPNKTPSKPTRRNATTLSGIKVKDTAAIPAHLKPEAPKIEPGRNDRDVDYEEGPKGTMMEKLDYYRRNYRVSLVGKRMKHSMEDRLRNMGYGSGKKMTEQQARRKKRAEDYEIERRRRFENRS